jgi:hypothetical protein
MYLHVIEACYELYLDVPPGSLPTLDVRAGDLNVLSLQIATSVGKVSGPYTFKIEGAFTVENIALTDWLTDLALDNFNLEIRGKSKSSNLIRRVVLIGALLHLLCSTDAVPEQAVTTIHEVLCDNAYDQQSLGLHFQYLVFCHLKQTLERVLDDIRSEELVVLSHAERENLFAVTAILRQETRHFRRNLEVAILWRTGLVRIH